jgi:hypothetical protein
MLQRDSGYSENQRLLSAGETNTCSDAGNRPQASIAVSDSSEDNHNEGANTDTEGQQFKPPNEGYKTPTNRKTNVLNGDSGRGTPKSPRVVLTIHDIHSGLKKTSVGTSHSEPPSPSGRTYKNITETLGRSPRFRHNCSYSSAANVAVPLWPASSATEPKTGTVLTKELCNKL